MGFVVVALLADVADAVALFVASDTTTTVVDVLCAVSLDSEGKVGKFVVDNMVEVFASVNVFEGTMDVGAVDEQMLAELKPKCPLRKLQMVRFVEGATTASSAMSGSVRLRNGLRGNAAPGARVVALINAGGPW